MQLCRLQMFWKPAEHGAWQIQSAVAAWHRDTVETRLAGDVQVFEGLACIHHAAVFEMWPLEVHGLRVGLDGVGCHVARDVEYASVVLYRVGVVDGCIVVFGSVLEAVFFQFDKTFHHGVGEMEINLRMVSIVICHNSLFLSP